MGNTEKDTCRRKGSRLNLEKSIGSRKATQALGAPGKSEKSLITNKVTTSFSDSPGTPIANASFSRPIDFSRLKLSYSALLFSLLALLPLNLLADGAVGNAPELLLAKRWSDELDVRNYWVSEKYDGIRALWNGHQFRTRKGNPIQAPDWFTRGFPDHPLDGELWIGRQRFEDLVSTIRKEHPIDEEWRRVHYMVFELPDGEGDFSQRLATLKKLLQPTDNPHIELVRQERIDDPEILSQRLHDIVAKGGEGLMLHKADARYHTGRSSDLLKLKMWQDAEATVIGLIPGKGKFSGMMGSLLLQSDSGRKFRVGTGFTHQQRQHPPPLGATVTYKYFGKTGSGLPRFASFMRIRSEP